jgi:ferredoxin-type protein NapG
MKWKWRGKTDDGKGKPRINRRDLLQGKLWKLVRPLQDIPLVMRYPKTADDIEPSEATKAEPPKPEPTTRHIGGIAIEAVAPTRLTPTQAKTIPVFRPPGAIEEGQFLAGCTRCNDCADACPHDAIRKAPERLGSIAGTPTIQADTAACMMCEDFPCIAACEPGVLVDSIPKIMGTARVTEQLCLAHHGTTCTVCSERCPVQGAIRVADGKPTIVEHACVGCGVCRYVCPAPENAILLMPAFLRPALPTT